jgi:hypothetical protein
MYGNISYVPPSSASSNSGNSEHTSVNNEINTSTNSTGNKGYSMPSSSSENNDINVNENYDSTRWGHHYNTEYSNGRGAGRGGYSSGFIRGGGGRGRDTTRGGWGSGRGGGTTGGYYNVNNNNNNIGYDGYNNGMSGSHVPYYYGRDIHNAPNNAYDQEMYPESRTNVGFESGNFHDISIEQTKDDKESERSRIEDEKLQKERELERKRELEKRKESEFREKHWIGRLNVKGDLKQILIKGFDELDAVNSNLLDIGARRVELEIDVDRYNRILKAEDDRVRLAEESLEAMNLSV